MIRQGTIVTALTILVLTSSPPRARATPGEAVGASSSDTKASLRRILDDEWEWRAAQFPEDATDSGDHRYDDKLTDHSAAAVALRREHHREFRDALQAIDHIALRGEDRLSWDIFSLFADLAVREDELLLSMGGRRGARWSADDSPFALNLQNGPQFDLPLLARATRFRFANDYAHYLSRLRALPASLESSRIFWMPGAWRN